MHDRTDRDPADKDTSTGWDDPWTEARKRRAAWRAKRDERRAAWRAHLYGHGAHHGWGNWGDMGAGEPRKDNSAEVAALQKQVADMARTVATLAARVGVLERLAVNDETRLAAEIEKLRDRDGRSDDWASDRTASDDPDATGTERPQR
jgi:hypothetical protein